MTRTMPESIRTRATEPSDREFLYGVYASTRQEELAATGWGAAEIETFLRMQFNLQHAQYQNYPTASFDVILVDDVPAGRFYVDRGKEEIRLVDIALLPEFRGRGIGSRLIGDLVREADTKGLVLSLHVERNNPILGFYSAQGFRTKAERGIYLYMERAPGAASPGGAKRVNPRDDVTALSTSGG